MLRDKENRISNNHESVLTEDKREQKCYRGSTHGIFHTIIEGDKDTLDQMGVNPLIVAMMVQHMI